MMHTQHGVVLTEISGGVIAQSAFAFFLWKLLLDTVM